ncbi:aspartic peptidase domain-containing protein [Xylariales sp. PMI_506]|nr:aspartic peptidase domain-containing protein [Xylariales sp. PMI_506]
MRGTATILQFALWSTGVHAFPHTLSDDSPSTGDLLKRDASSPGIPGFVTFKLSQSVARAASLEDGESISSRVSRVAHSLAKKYGAERPSRTTHEGVTLAERANTYSVSTPIATTQSNSVGIYQDGSDTSYFIQAQFGSASTPMYMLVDTGASTTWVMGSGCGSAPCTTHNTYGSSDSTTLNLTGTAFSVEYGSGDVSGELVSDTIKIADISLDYSFGLANVTSSQFSSFPFDGILGLSRGSGNFMQAVSSAKALKSNVFGVTINRASDGVNNGELSFGAPDPAKYTGDISYTTVDDDSSWAIPIGSVTIGGSSASITSKVAYIDTGTTFAFAPPADAAALYKLIPNSYSSDGITYTFPCSTAQTVSFTFSGKTYAIAAEDFISGYGGSGNCTGNVYGMEVVSGAWLLGDVFLKNVYTVFDFDESRIGMTDIQENIPSGLLCAFINIPLGFAAKSVVTASASTASATAYVSTMTTGGSTIVTTITSSATSHPSMGFTGGNGAASGTLGSSSAAETTPASSTTAASGGSEPPKLTMLIWATSLVSIIAAFV